MLIFWLSLDSGRPSIHMLVWIMMRVFCTAPGTRQNLGSWQNPELGKKRIAPMIDGNNPIAGLQQRINRFNGASVEKGMFAFIFEFDCLPMTIAIDFYDYAPNHCRTLRIRN
jgi:hypothetical protein